MGAPELVSRAAELAGGDLAGALRALRDERTFDLQAAYATAVRRRPELIAAIWFAAEILRWITYAGRGGWAPALVTFAAAAVVYGAFLLLLRRLYVRAADTAEISVAAQGRTDLTIVSDVVRAVVERAAEVEDPSPDVLADVAVGASRGPAASLLAAAGLSRAERLLTASLRPSDRRRAGSISEARQELLARERHHGRALPDLLGRG